MAPLSWDAFLEAVKGGDAAHLTEDRLFDLAARLRVDAALMAPHVRFSREGYARNTLYRDASFEAICLCWLPGQGTPVHNHGRSFGVVHVYEGVMGCAGFRRVDDGTRDGHAVLERATLSLAAPGSLLLDRVGSIHRLFNPPEAAGPCVSLHFYAGPLDWMEVFDPGRDAVEVRPMQGEPVGPGCVEEL
ncbi:MAG: cysteine dioxygenase family protein [Candidatus Sericytochromatia bacterium]|nr:cysteine dioxygenase family protein [Candidatus Sericytochromatia bacterium]